MYEDRLDGGITIDKYSELVAKTDQRLQEIDNEIVRLEKTQKESTFDVSYLLKLASMSEKLLKSSKVEVKNEILRLLLSNLEIKQKRLQFKVLEPFCYLQKMDPRPNWLPKPACFRKTFWFSNDSLRFICNLVFWIVVLLLSSLFLRI